MNNGKRLGDLMLQLKGELSQEGKEAFDETQVGAAKILVVTDETTTELEESIEELAASVNKKVEQENLIENVIEATESLESNLAFLERMEEAGQPLNGAALLAWHQGITASFEARKLDPADYMGELDAILTSFENNTEEDQTKSAKEVIKGSLSKLGGMASKAWEWLRQTVTLIATQVVTSSKKLKAAAENLKTAAGKIDSTEAKREINSSGYKELVTGGKVDPAAAVAGAIKAVGTTKGKIDTLSTSIDQAKAMLESGAPMEGIACPWSDGESVGFVGGAELKVSIKDGKFIKSSQSVKVTATAAEGDKAPGSTAPLSKAEIVSVADALVRLADATEGAVNALKAKFDTNKEFKASDKANKDTAKAIAGALAVVNSVSSQVNAKALSVGKKAYTYALQSAKMYGAAPKAAEGGEEGGEAATA